MDSNKVQNLATGCDLKLFYWVTISKLNPWPSKKNSETEKAIFNQNKKIKCQ